MSQRGVRPRYFLYRGARCYTPGCGGGHFRYLLQLMDRSSGVSRVRGRAILQSDTTSSTVYSGKTKLPFFSSHRTDFIPGFPHSRALGRRSPARASFRSAPASACGRIFILNKKLAAVRLASCVSTPRPHLPPARPERSCIPKNFGIRFSYGIPACRHVAARAELMSCAR